jgi:hypothetical protein
MLTTNRHGVVTTTITKAAVKIETTNSIIRARVPLEMPVVAIIEVKLSKMVGDVEMEESRDAWAMTMIEVVVAVVMVVRVIEEVEDHRRAVVVQWIEIMTAAAMVIDRTVVVVRVVVVVEAVLVAVDLAREVMEAKLTRPTLGVAQIMNKKKKAR